MVNQKCSHPDCNCPIAPGQGVERGGQTYCSTHCAEMGARKEDSCSCGHRDC